MFLYDFLSLHTQRAILFDAHLAAGKAMQVCDDPLVELDKVFFHSSHPHPLCRGLTSAPL